MQLPKTEKYAVSIYENSSEERAKFFFFNHAILEQIFSCVLSITRYKIGPFSF